MGNVVPIYSRSQTTHSRIKVGSAWKRRRQMTMRIDIYQNTLGDLETYRTSDGQEFLLLMIPIEDFFKLGTKDTEMGYAEAIDEDEVELVGYIRAAYGDNPPRQKSPSRDLEVSLSIGSIMKNMAPNNYGKSMFAMVPLNAIRDIRDGTRSVGAVSMRKSALIRSGEMETPFLINRISFSLGSRVDEA